METFSSYNKKLSGYNNVSETVKVIEKIAASALHDTNRGMESLNEYTNHLQTFLSRITQLQGLTVQNKTAYAEPTSKKRTLLVVVTGDKGLVGDMWRRLFSEVAHYSFDELLVLGKKGMHFFPEKNTHTQHYQFTKRIPPTNEILILATKLFSSIESKKYTNIDIAHLKPVSLLEQKVEISKLLPIENKSDSSLGQHSVLGYPIINTPLPQLQVLLSEKYIHSRLRQVILETAISEFSARTVSMEHAGTKTDEERMLLTRRYYKDHRQRETQKQLERFASNHAII